MPLTSDYYCDKCEKAFEYDKFYGEENFPEHPPCPNCKGVNTKRKYACHTSIPHHMKSVNS